MALCDDYSYGYAVLRLWLGFGGPVFFGGALTASTAALSTGGSTCRRPFRPRGRLRRPSAAFAATRAALAAVTSPGPISAIWAGSAAAISAAATLAAADISAVSHPASLTITFGRPMRRPICSLKTSAATIPDLSDTAATYDGVALQFAQSLAPAGQDHRRAMLYLRGELERSRLAIFPISPSPSKSSWRAS